MGETASPSSAKKLAASPSAADARAGGAEAADVGSPAVEDGLEPLEYFLLDYAGQLPDGLADKLKANIEIHEDFVTQLQRRNEKLRRKTARLKDGEAATPGDGDPRAVAEGRRRELVALGAASSIAAAQEAHKRVAAEAYEAALQAKLTRTCRRAEARLASMTRKAEKAEEDARKQTNTAILERARARREFENVGSELTRTEANISNLEDAIRIEARKFRDKEAERKAVAKEVEALRCEARAHRARAGKHIRTEQRIQDMTRELEATRASLARLSRKPSGARIV